MVLGFFEAAIGVLATIVLAAAAVGSRSLTPWAGVVAAFFGCIIVVTVGFAYLALLVIFVVGSGLATRYHFEEKARRHVQEGSHGERGISNVLAHILIPTALAVAATAYPASIPPAALSVLYASALAFGAADTFASEFGVLAARARSILTLEPVRPGTNGGVSVRGELWALVGSLTTAFVGLGVLLAGGSPTPGILTFTAIVAISGLVGCQVDSILGELLENRGYLTKGSTNFASMFAAVLLAGALLLPLGVF
ncbi:MAG: DUF92 domain-containing protein [Thermoplasmata archaeon]